MQALADLQRRQAALIHGGFNLDIAKQSAYGRGLTDKAFGKAVAPKPAPKKTARPPAAPVAPKPKPAPESVAPAVSEPFEEFQIPEPVEVAPPTPKPKVPKVKEVRLSKAGKPAKYKWWREHPAWEAVRMVRRTTAQLIHRPPRVYYFADSDDEQEYYGGGGYNRGGYHSNTSAERYNNYGDSQRYGDSQGYAGHGGYDNGRVQRTAVDIADDDDDLVVHNSPDNYHEFSD